MKIKRSAASLLIIICIIISGCAGNKNNRDIDYEAEFEKGKIAFDKKKYVRAQDHFNKVVISASHTDIGDDAMFYLGESYFLSENEYLLAIAEYDRLIRRMPFSPFVEKARFRICESYVIMSPKYFRDQTYSEKAIEKLQEFIDDYPNSEKRASAQESISILRDKLSNKAYESGILYMKMEEYEAASLAFKQVVDLYYDTDFIEKAHVKIIECLIEQKEFDEAKSYFETNRSQIEKIRMDDLVSAWIQQKRVIDRIELYLIEPN